nr:group-specific protein [Bacillus cereus]
MDENKYVLASTPIFLGVVCIAIYNIIGVIVGSDTLEYFFFLIQLTTLSISSGVVVLLFVTIFSVFKYKNN